MCLICVSQLESSSFFGTCVCICVCICAWFDGLLIWTCALEGCAGSIPGKGIFADIWDLCYVVLWNMGSYRFLAVILIKKANRDWRIVILTTYHLCFMTSQQEAEPWPLLNCYVNKLIILIYTAN